MPPPESVGTFHYELESLVRVVEGLENHNKECLAIIHIVMWYNWMDVPINIFLIKRLLFTVVVRMLYLQLNPDNTTYKDMKELDQSITNKKTSYQLVTEVIDIFNNIFLNTFKPNIIGFPQTFFCTHLGYTDMSTGQSIDTKPFEKLKKTMFDLIKESFSQELPNLSTLPEQQILPQHKKCYDWYDLEEGSIKDCLTKDTGGLEENILFVTPNVKSPSDFDYGVICVSKSILRKSLHNDNTWFYRRNGEDTELYLKITSITVGGDNVYIPVWSLLKILISKQKTFYILPVHDVKRYIATSDGTHIVEIAVCEGDLAITPDQWVDLENNFSRSSSQMTEIYDADEYDRMTGVSTMMSPGLLGGGEECFSLSQSEINIINRQLEKSESRQKTAKEVAYDTATEYGDIGHHGKSTRAVARTGRKNRPY